ncbi:MAG: hypothetical protein ACLP9S_14480, partial [Syntrophales bacterium]
GKEGKEVREEDRREDDGRTKEITFFNLVFAKNYSKGAMRNYEPLLIFWTLSRGACLFQSCCRRFLIFSPPTSGEVIEQITIDLSFLLLSVLINPSIC